MPSPRDVTHYDVLGVDRGASAVEIRQAYVRLARDHHPDHHAASTPEIRAAAEARMRAVNEAWRELGDPLRRRRYDRALDAGPGGVLRDGVVEPERPSTWRPFDADADDGLGDDPFGEALARPPTAGRLLAIAPVVALVGGAGAVLLGALVDLRPLLALGFTLLAFSGLLFVVAPLAIVLESRRRDRL